LYDAIDRWCLRRCDRVICLSRHYERLLGDAGIRRDRLVRIPSGLRDLPASLPPGSSSPGSPVTFGMMGRFSEEKNHRLFLRAAAKVARERPGTRFLLAGTGPLEERLRAEADRPGLRDSLVFPGYLPVETFMAQIDVYVICSRIENLPYSILEAMAWGKPVIGTHVGGVPDLIIPGKTGFLTPPGDVTDLAGEMMRLVDEPATRAVLGAAGRLRVEQEFSLPVCAERHVSLYRELVGEGGR
jgi:glycosyltransferase involved in cell wall biosynthesis